jgi:predicted nucleic-acid-binding Zn-ribbon protein
MQRVDKCVKCSAEVIQHATVVDIRQLDGNLRVSVASNPDALMFKNATYSAVHAYICSACGYTELYADNPRELYEAYQVAKSKSGDLGLE